MKGLKGLVLLFSPSLFNHSVVATELNIVTEHLAPFQIVSEYAVGGFSTEIVETVLKASGYQYLLEAHPWSTSYHRAKHIENTCIYSLAYTQARKSKFRWVGHITKSASSFYSLTSNPIEISQLNEAIKYNTAVIKDDVTHQFLLNKGFVENDNLYVMDSYDSILKLLATPSRHIDLVVVNNSLIQYLSRKAGTASKYRKVYMLKDLSLNFYFACSLQTKQSVVDDIKQTMARLEQGGILSKIRQKWQTNMQ